jgi:antigen 43
MRAFLLFTHNKVNTMKRNLNTSYRLVWNEVLGAFVVVSELAKAKGKRTGAVLALAVAGLTSGAALAAEISVPVGETTDGVVISNNDTQLVYGQANNTTINTGLEYGSDDEDNNQGGQYVQVGGVVNHTTINSNGLQAVLQGGSASDTTVNAGGGQSVHGQSSGTVLNGGEQWVHSGGVASDTVINEGGYLIVKEGAQAVGTVVNTGAQGGPDAENSDGMFVSGTATNTTINENGRQVVFGQGTAVATTIKSGGDQSVHGQAKNTVLNGGYQYVHSGALATDTVVNNGGWQVVKAEGTANNTVINANGRQSVSGNANSTTLNGALNAGGECGFDCINHYDFATQEVRDGGVATETTINAGGSQLIAAGGRSDATTINADGRQIVEGGTATNTIIKEHAWQSVQNNGYAIDTTLGNAGSTELLSDLAYQNVSAGGMAEGTVINNGGVQSVYEGGTAVNSVVNRGGRLEISVWDEEPASGQQTPAAGTARNVTVEAGGWLSVDSGASVTDVVMKKGSALWATTDSTVKGSNSLGAFDIDGATRQASNVLLENGGRLEVLSGGVADATTVDKGGILAVNNGGTATDVTMKEGGALIADSGSTVSGTNARGEFSIDAASGNARGLWLENGGRFSVKADAVAENTIVGSGGELSVGTGGGLSGTTSLTANANLTVTGDVVSTGTIENAGSITFAPEQSGKAMVRLPANAFTPRTLTTTNLVGQGGTINMNINLANPDFPADRLVIDGGRATGKTWLNFTNAGDAGLGFATTGDGIKVVEAINGATTDAGGFCAGQKAAGWRV